MSKEDDKAGYTEYGYRGLEEIKKANEKIAEFIRVELKSPKLSNNSKSDTDSEVTLLKSAGSSWVITSFNVSSL